MSFTTLPHSYAKLLQSEKFSDVVLKCQDKEFKVHKAIVCSQSDVLLAACDGEFKVRSTSLTLPVHCSLLIWSVFKEATSNIINIDEFEPETVEQMVKYMYTGRYFPGPLDDMPDDTVDVETLSTTAEPSNHEATDAQERKTDSKSTILERLLPHIKVNAIGDYYAIPKLCYLANLEIQCILNVRWSPSYFSAVIESATNLTGDRTLHEVLATAAAGNIESLVDAWEIIPCMEMANNVIRKVVAANRETVKRYDDQITGLQAQIAALKQESENGEKARKNVRLFIDLLNRTPNCRNNSCKETFPLYMEPQGHPAHPSYALRCTSCKCRHEL